MKKILIWGDNPLGITGFGKVIKNLIEQIKNPGWEIDVLGISFWGDRDDFVLGYRLFSALEPGQAIDLFGNAKLYRLLKTGNYDILFILNDLPIVAKAMPEIAGIREQSKKTFRIIHYFPVDGPVWEDEVKGALGPVDFPVCYTNFGRDIVSKFDRKLKTINVIYHGTDKKLFHPFSSHSERQKAKEAFFDIGTKKRSKDFIVLNVNRNQPRKDMAKCFEVFSEFKKKAQNAYLFVMADPADIGGDLIRISKQYGLEWGTDWWSAPIGSQTKSNGFPESQIANLYRISDLVISTTTGEGWGLSLTEAMASLVPVVFPRHTACLEIIGEKEERGFLADCGGKDGTFTWGLNDRNVIRPRVWTDSMVEKMMEVYLAWGKEGDGVKDGVKDKAKEAWSWIPTWDTVGVQWREVFCSALEDV